MNIGYILMVIVSLLSGLGQAKPKTDPVLFVGPACPCLQSIQADCADTPQKLYELASSREYRRIVVFEPVANRTQLARYLIKTQPQAEIILTEDPELAAKFRIQYAPSCTSVLELLQKDREYRWKHGF